MKSILDISAILCFIGGAILFVGAYVVDDPTHMMMVMAVSSFASGAVFAAISKIYERVERTQELVEWMAKEIQILRNGNAAGKDAE